MNTLYNYRPHAFQLTGHDTPVLSQDRVSLELVPFDQSPSLHPLRDGWLSRLVKYMLRFFDRAGFGNPSRFRDLRYGLPLSPTVSAPRSSLSRLNGWPAHAFVNASRLASRPTAHDSRSVWFVRPLSYDSFIHNNLPV
jgi:hypothetical protein